MRRSASQSSRPKARKRWDRFGAEFISAPKHFSRSVLSSSRGSLLRFTPRGKAPIFACSSSPNGSNASVWKRKKEMSGWSFPRQGETEQSEFSSDAVRGAKRILFSTRNPAKRIRVVCVIRRRADLRRWGRASRKKPSGSPPHRRRPAAPPSGEGPHPGRNPLLR